MPRNRSFAFVTVAVGFIALVHAALTWPRGATIAVFGGGAVVAFVAQAVVINLGVLEHHVRPKLLGVPLYVRFGWAGAVYVGWIVVSSSPAALALPFL